MFCKYEITPGEEASSWEKLSADRIARYSKAWVVLKGARLREGLSQKELSKKSRISQENLSKIENGKRPVGEKVAKKLAQVLHIDYKLLINK